MQAGNNIECQKIIQSIQSSISSLNKNNPELLHQFAQTYFQAVAYDDLKEFTGEELTNLLISHWEFMQGRRPGETKIRIFNPVEGKDGWNARHTVIQISTDDIPFLVDSTRMAVTDFGIQVHFIIHFGGFRVRRSEDTFNITEILPVGFVEAGVSSEAPIYIEIDRILDPKLMTQLKTNIERSLSDAKLAVSDWRRMVMRVEESLNELENSPPKLDLSELAESRDFLRWLISNNFTFLGCRDYKLIGDGKNRALQLVTGSGLGVLRDETQSKTAKMYAELPPQARKMALSNTILIIAKTNTLSTVHRQVYTDYIGVKRFNEDGELIGERRFVGLFTSTAYHSSPRHIPFLRLKVDNVLKDLGFPPDSHDGKESIHVLETLPRDDLFQASHQELLELTLGIIQIKERKRVRLLVRRDSYDRYFSCLVYVPREIFTSQLAISIQSILMDSFRGVSCLFNTYFSDSNLARLHYLIRVNPKEVIQYDVKAVEMQIIQIARSWLDDLRDECIERYGEVNGLKQFTLFIKTFPASYQESYTSNQALDDVEVIAGLNDLTPLGLSLSKQMEDSIFSLKLYHLESTIILSDVIPILENMGLRIIGEKPHILKFSDAKKFWINDFTVTVSSRFEIDIYRIQSVFNEAFLKIWFGQAENDGLNRLVLECGLNWHQITMLRAYTKYLKQIGFTFSQTYIEQALISNPELTKSLVQLFEVKFNPSEKDRETSSTAELIKYIEQALDTVASLDEDRIIRRMLEMIQVTLRTNYFQLNEAGAPKSYLSLKINSNEISDLVLPKPKYEIFVYSPTMEGIHLRAGKVARGGLRWSDRREDFRTEVLGLMKAQHVKNTLIVPEGAKGGFVLKQMLVDANRDELLKAGIAAYSTFISGMLDITDNIVGGSVVPPNQVVRYDDDDPYLVVAADKGTATFSDIANEIAKRYAFWLDDAFASGGSAGYDHKKMGITSRGVWVSVLRHFRELGKNPERDPFTVVGIGDMSGDVFGNGMLLSNQIKLVGAFNHIHIFVDPNPNPLTSYEERKRLFGLPRSSWIDYKPELISTGGGVFNRTAKSIKLTPEMKQLLNIQRDALSPNELIRALFKAEVDLIWNGGIGTFVKSTLENHLEVGDRTNDNIRIDAAELRARVVAEGGNLGMTQLARIEYALNGGIVNTDFIDNSAGVDCSDHEVNIKILLNRLMMDGLMTREERDALLQNMTQEVAELVLLDNYDQTQMLSLEASVSQLTMDLFKKYMIDLEKQGRLDRNLEYLPSDKVLLDRKANNTPLTKPEIAILLAYSKMYLKRDLINSEIPDNAYFSKYLLKAFPKILGDNYFSAMTEHSLKREIIATQLCKSITDRMGINFIERLQRETGAVLTQIVNSYVVASSIFDLESLWHEITLLDNKIDQSIQHRMMLQLYYLIRRATRWFVRNRPADMDIQQTIDEFHHQIQILTRELPGLLDLNDREAFHAAATYYTEQHVPNDLAYRLAACYTLFTALDIVEAASKHHLNLHDVAEMYYKLGNRLELNWVRELVTDYAVENQWDELAKAGFRDDIDRIQHQLTAKVLLIEVPEQSKSTIDERIDCWIHSFETLLTRWYQLLADIKSSESSGFVAYSVLLRELLDFAQLA